MSCRGVLVVVQRPADPYELSLRDTHRIGRPMQSWRSFRTQRWRTPMPCWPSGARPTGGHRVRGAVGWSEAAAVHRAGAARRAGGRRPRRADHWPGPGRPPGQVGALTGTAGAGVTALLVTQATEWPPDGPPEERAGEAKRST